MKKNADAIEMLADMIEPAIEIFTDEEIIDSFRNDPALKAATRLLKTHPDAVLRIICAYDGIPYEEADYTAIDLLKKVMNIVNDSELMGFFSQQAASGIMSTISGDATEATPEGVTQ